MADWNTANSNRFYPFQVNTSAIGLDSTEILDARFFIVNPSVDAPKVWLANKAQTEEGKTYTFQNSAGGVMTFTVPTSEEVQCIWNTDEADWYGYCVFGGTAE